MASDGSLTPYEATTAVVPPQFISTYDSDVAGTAFQSEPPTPGNFVRLELRIIEEDSEFEEDSKQAGTADDVSLAFDHPAEELETIECTVCLETLQDGQIATTLPCGHAFHQDCIMRWLGTKVYNQQAGCCPSCNFRVIAPIIPRRNLRQSQDEARVAAAGSEAAQLELPPPITQPISSQISPLARYSMLVAAAFAFLLFVTIAILKAVNG